ncbi:hypothetical protein ACFO4P_15925 [Epilithonimonas pallida]|uniref:Uncharacterized protein n=1 Tax=Epilithonimonas pallida TaxID=373671 RepID=A0ABY1QY46_9FLAO|nr:hypothetical protein [Epilithonimonas pallida]SMP88618.1 hypothetical protein SAMN05421679_101522 [Epilithonimonas pallida]
MLNTRLKTKRVKYVKINNIEYFDVQDIKDNHPELKIEVDKIVRINDVALIVADYVHLTTEFDKMMKQVFKK